MKNSSNDNNTNVEDYLSVFKKAYNGMVAKSNQAYKGRWSQHRYTDSVREYTPEEIEKIVESGSLDEQVKLSRNYFAKDGFYRRLVMYYATILKQVGILIPSVSVGKDLSTDFIARRYYSALNFIDKLNLQDMFTEWSKKAIIEGVYYGAILRLDKSNLVILDLPTEYCCSRFKDDRGNDVVEFNVRFFDTITDPDLREKWLTAYPNVISNAYRQFGKGKLKDYWVMLPTEIGICIPFLDSRPTFLSVIPATIDYGDAKETTREKEKDEIKKIITQHIPHTNDGTLIFEPPEAEVMHKGIVDMVKNNDNISVVTSYGEIGVETSKTSNDVSSNYLEKMMNNIYYESGASPQIFAATSNLALSTSLQDDLAMMMTLAYKYSRFVTNIVNRLFSNTNITFTYKILPISYYNDSKYIEDSFKLAGSGYSFLLPALALGIGQKEFSDIKHLENDLLKLDELLTPLSSSYTSSGGAPTKEDSQKSATTIERQTSLEKNGGSSQ